MRRKGKEIVYGETVGQKVVQVQETLGWTQERLAGILGVSRGTVSTYKKRANANPSVDKVQRLVEILTSGQKSGREVITSWLFDGQRSDIPAELRAISKSDTSTNVYYNDHEGKAAGGLDPSVVETSMMFTGPRIVRMKVMAGEGSRLWSVKGAQRVDLTAFDWFEVGGRYLVKVDGDSLGVKKRGRVLGFEPDDFPHPNRLLLCAMKSNQDIRTIRYVDGSKLLSPDTQVAPESLAEWDVLGWASLDIRPRGDLAPGVTYVPEGIAP